jgi:hypothetical protein
VQFRVGDMGVSAGEDPLGWRMWLRIGYGSGGSEQNKIPGRAPGMLAYAATGWAAGAGVGSAWAAGRAGLVTLAMKRSASLVALSRERHG